MDADLARIRFVTTRYGELKGFHQIASVVGCLLLFWSRPYLRLFRFLGAAEAILGLFLAVLPCVLIAAAHPLINRYYVRRFGSVSGADGWSRDSIAWVFLMMAAFWIDLAVSTGGPSAVLLAAAAVALHITVRDWPWRKYYLAAAAFYLVSAWLTAAMPPVHGYGAAPLLQIGWTIALGGYAVMAYLDHRLLVRTLSPDRELHTGDLADDHAEPV